MSDDNQIISTYTRAQALNDGTLINISETAKTVGYKYPMAITSTLAADLTGHSAVFWTLYRFAKLIAETSQEGNDLIVLKDVEGGEAWLHLGPGDNGEPVLTLMRPQDW